MTNIPTQSWKENQTQVPINKRKHRSDQTVDQPDVHVATREDYDSVDALITVLLQQETRDPLDESNCCNGGDHGFRTDKTNLPTIRAEDITPGQLIYRPTTEPLHVYEIQSEPYTNDHGFRTVDVHIYSRNHAGDNPELRTREDTLFVASVLDEMTFIQPETIQEQLPT